MLHVVFAAALASWAASAAPALDAALTAPTLRGAYVGALVAQADDGAVVYDRHADDGFAPASTLKLLVGSAALATLGTQFSFDTQVLTNGTISDGILHGDLYIRGGGDPTLIPFDMAAAASAVASAGINHVTGSVYTDATRYTGPRYPDGWAVDDIGNDYAAPVSALSFQGNAVAITIHPGPAPGAPAALEANPASDSLRIDDAVVTGAPHTRNTTALQSIWYEPTMIRVTGSFPIDAPAAGEVDAAVPDPPSLTLELFSKQLTRLGISADGGTRTGGTTPATARVLWSRRSGPMLDLLAKMWQPSDNLLAELLLNELGVGAPGATTADAGIAREQQWLTSIGVDPHTVTLVDGSGLSQYDRITPRALAGILSFDWHSRLRPAVLRALPLAGRRGTLEHVFLGTPLVDQVFAKTGTLYHARALAGYITTHHHGTLIFVLLVNNWMHDGEDGAVSAVRQAQAQFLEALLDA